ncbi:MAG: GNAT family N-acetyltransferase [Pseudomonadota bacterium]
MIRPAKMEDLDVVRRIAEAAFAPFVPLIGRRPAPMDADFFGAIRREEVSVIGQPPTAYLLCQRRGEDLQIENLAVHPDHHSAGLGRLLVDHAVDTARRRGLARITLYTNETMAGALRFYPRLGFTEVARRTEAGFHRVYFEHPL